MWIDRRDSRELDCDFCKWSSRAPNLPNPNPLHFLVYHFKWKCSDWRTPRFWHRTLTSTHRDIDWLYHRRKPRLAFRNFRIFTYHFQVNIATPSQSQITGEISLIVQDVIESHFQNIPKVKKNIIFNWHIVNYMTGISQKRSEVNIYQRSLNMRQWKC